MKERIINFSEHKVYVLDEVLSPTEEASINDYLHKLPYLKQERDNDRDDHPSFSADLKPKRFELDTSIGQLSRKLMDRYYQDEQYVLFRAAVNMMTRGDMEIPHYDCPLDRHDITLLYYANSTWQYDWGGETLFYKKQEPAFGILPRPGRIILFPGVIEHKAGIPNRHCPDTRYTLALKFITRQELLQQKQAARETERGEQ